MKVLMKNYLIQFQMSIGDEMMGGRMDRNDEKKVLCKYKQNNV